VDLDNIQAFMNILQVLLMVILVPVVKFFWEVKLFIEKETYITKFLLDNLDKKVENIEKNIYKEIQELKQKIKELEDGE
jgi:sensor domain CHASE-containing protein